VVEHVRALSKIDCVYCRKCEKNDVAVKRPV
jgi:hypothetical protein